MTAYEFAHNGSNGTEMWDWSFEDMAMFDIPKVLQYIYNTTGVKVNYIGHSLGAATGLMALQEDENLLLVKNYIGLGTDFNASP